MHYGTEVYHLQPRYNSSLDELILTLSIIHIRRQNEVWYAATFLLQDGTNIDLAVHKEKVMTPLGSLISLFKQEMQICSSLHKGVS